MYVVIRLRFISILMFVQEIDVERRKEKNHLTPTPNARLSKMDENRRLISGLRVSWGEIRRFLHQFSVH